MSCKLVYGKGKIGPFFRFFFWVPSLITMRNFRNGMVSKKTMSRAMLLMFPTHCHQVFFCLTIKSYFEWLILRSQSVQLSCWIRAIQDHFSDRNRLNRGKPRGGDLSDVVPLSFNQGLSLIESHSMKVKICFQDHPFQLSLLVFFWCLVADVLKIS